MALDREYLKEHYLTVYIEDAISQWLEYTSEGKNSPTVKPLKLFFKDYFNSVHQGTHVLFREYQFVSASPYNRVCALKAIMQIYQPFLYHQEYSFNAKEYHSIIELLFKGFPLQVIEDAIEAYEDEGAKDKNNRLNFIDFIRAMRSSFCTGPFDFEATKVYHELKNRMDDFYGTIPEQTGENYKLTEEDFLHFYNEGVRNDMFDGSELKTLLNLHDSKSVSSDEAVSGGKLSPSESKSRKKIMGAKEETRGRLVGKCLSKSLNEMPRNKKEDAKIEKPRSKSGERKKKKPWK